MTTKQKRLILTAILTGIVGLISSITLVGNQARLVHVITIFSAGFGSGAALVSALYSRKVGEKDMLPQEKVKE